ncbi:MAG: hypothetical protein HC888_00640 [Candidatus Competibacteraceae bacterium]|nr:hypothetical protein [Candidatus Competibacteraceae bacterium]
MHSKEQTVTTTTLRKILSPGVKYYAQILKALDPKMREPMMRVVTKQQPAQMESELLEGPKKGQLIYLDWKWKTAHREDGKIIISDRLGPFMYLWEPGQVPKGMQGASHLSTTTDVAESAEPG